MTQLSAYVLTHDSERHLAAVLARLLEVADDIVVLDSGSTDRTLDIATRFRAAIHHRDFDDFVRQREHAVRLCQNEWVLFVDSDEIPDLDLVDALRRLKAEDFGRGRFDSFRVRREWIVLGRRVHSIYPIRSPDFPTRLYRRTRGHFAPNNVVHEKLVGLESTGMIESGALHHYTFGSEDEFHHKLDRYVPLAVEAHRRRGKPFGRLRGYLHAMAAWLKSYFIYRGCLDGRTGMLCARYAYSYTLRKYCANNDSGDT